MRSIDEQTRPPAATSPMSRSQNTFLAGIRGEFFEPADAVVMFSEMLLTETGDLGQERFAQDLRRIHDSGRRLREIACEFFDLRRPDGPDEDPALATIERTLRHDMLNALNVVINYSEEWIEDCEEQFLQGFLPDLQRIYEHSKKCLEVLNRIRAVTQGEELPPAEPAPELMALWDPERPAAQPAGEPGHCLVVDDSATNRDILTRLLVRQGHSVVTAENGREALEKVQAEPFDLVLLDIMMPQMNGFQVLEHLKSNERLRDLPVLMISALDQIDSVVRCIAMGAEDYLSKPFNPLLLKARIGACLEKKRFRDREQLYLRQIEQEKQRSDELLHVILPEKIVAELKETNEVRPRRYDNVAVLFADIVGFTPYCDRHGPEQVVPHLQSLVESWENSALRHGVEKIKTIGDAFMAASGLLRPADNPVLCCVRCGLEMIAAAQALPVGWDLRVGIHVGQVVAGVIGRRQYLFDLWGDTVNTAARMESHGIKGAITLSSEAWDWVAPLARGEPLQVKVKGKGEDALTLYRFCEFTQQGEARP